MHQVSTEDKQSLQKGQNATLDISNHGLTVINESGCAKASHVDAEDKTFVMLDIADSQNGNAPVGQSKTAFINESGLYSLILSSKLPTAKKFKRRVTSANRTVGGLHGSWIECLSGNGPRSSGLVQITVGRKGGFEKVYHNIYTGFGIHPRSYVYRLYPEKHISIHFGIHTKR